MKKHTLLKAIFIFVLIVILGSWVLPSSIVAGGDVSRVGYEPLGLIDVILAPLHFFNWTNIAMQLSIDSSTVLAFSYASILILIFVTGFFYSILHKTGAYGNMINSIVHKVQWKKQWFFLGTAIFFLLFSSFVGVKLVAFLFIPFFITILTRLGYSKLSSFSATFLACLVGDIVSITGSDITGINNIMYHVTVNQQLLMKFGLLVVVAFLYGVYAMSQKKVVDKEEIEESIEETDRSYASIILLSILFLVIFLIGSYNRYYVFQDSSMVETYNQLMSTSIGTYPIAMNLFGMMEPFGYWSGFTISGLLILLSFALCFIYSISFDDMLDSMKQGIVRMAKPVGYIILASIPMILLKLALETEGNFLITIAGFIYHNVTKLTVPFTTLLSFIFGLFNGNYLEFQSRILTFMSTFFTGKSLEIGVLTTQVMHGVVALVAPTSLFLVAGLGYLNISYREWFSYIWKLLLAIFLISLCILLVVSFL